jgi:hypothetical protein
MVVASARLRFIIFGLACLGWAGCAAKPLPVAETVEGTVTFNRAPVVGARVQFVPMVADGVKAPISSGTTDEKGFFRLIRDDSGKPGAVLGTHKVVIISGRLNEQRSRDEEAPPEPQSGMQVPSIYSSLGRTPLKVEVKADQTSYPLEIKEYMPGTK